MNAVAFALMLAAFGAPPAAQTGSTVNVGTLQAPTGASPFLSGGTMAGAGVFAARANYVRKIVACIGGQALGDALDFGLAESQTSRYSPLGWQYEFVDVPRVFTFTSAEYGVSSTGWIEKKMRVYADLDNGTRVYYRQPIAWGVYGADRSGASSSGMMDAKGSLSPDADGWYDFGAAAAAVVGHPAPVLATPAENVVVPSIASQGSAAAATGSGSTTLGPLSGFGGAMQSGRQQGGQMHGSARVHYEGNYAPITSAAFTLAGLPLRGAQPTTDIGTVVSAASANATVDPADGRVKRSQADDGVLGAFGTVGASAMVSNGQAQAAGFANADAALSAFLQSLPGATLDKDGNGTRPTTPQERQTQRQEGRAMATQPARATA